MQDLRLLDVADADRSRRHCGSFAANGRGLIREMVIPVQSAASPETLLGAPTYGSVRLAIGKALHWRYRLFQQRRHRHTVLESIGGVSLLVTPGVLNPRLMRTGAFF